MTGTILFVSPLLRFLTANHDIDGWDDVAVQWLLAIGVISVVSAILMTGGKWWIKAYWGRGIIKKVTWPHSWAWGFIALGFVVTVMLCFVCWSFGRDLRTIVGYQGLLVGMGLSGAMHLGIVAAFHGLFHWIRELS